MPRPAATDPSTPGGGPFTVLARRARSRPSDAAGHQDVMGEHRPLLHRLLRDLGRRCATRYAALWLPPNRVDGSTGSGWTPAVEWHSRSRRSDLGVPDSVDDPGELLRAPGVVAMADVTDGGIECGVLVLAHAVHAGTRRVRPVLLGETAVCVGLLVRQARHRAAGAAAWAGAAQADQRVNATLLELSTVQAAERDRLATAVTTAPTRQLREIQARIGMLDRALGGPSGEAEPIIATIRDGLHEMIEQFRTVVRGVYPQVLRGGGVRAALEEVAVSLPARVVFRGELGRRQGWEVESGLYQAAASAVAALSACRDAGPIEVTLGRDDDVLVIRAQRDGADPTRIAEVLRGDAQRLAALGGRLSVDRAPGSAAAVVGMQVPERLGRSLPALGDPTAPKPVEVPTERSAPAIDDGDVGAAGAVARHLLDLLAPGRDAHADVPPIRVALDRQDRRARVVLVGTGAEELIPVLCDRLGDPGWAPQVAARTPPLCYQYLPYRRITLDPPRGGPPWRPVRLPDRSVVAWPGAAADYDRILVEGPAEALRGVRLLHYRHRVDADLARRLCQWSGTADGPPDAVVLAAAAPVSAAEAEFLAELRDGAGEGFSPVVICALRDGIAVTPGSRRGLRATSDAIVTWHPAPGGGAAVETVLRTRLTPWVGVLAARWALRALRVCLATGQVDDDLAGAVEAAALRSPEVVELDLLQTLQGRWIRLPRGHDEAVRLLGGHGADPRSRLGLAGDVPPERVTDAARRALGYWRAHSVASAGGPAGRGAYPVLIRLCERLLANGTG